MCFISISVVKHCLIIFSSRVFHFHISSKALSNNIYVYCYLIYTLQWNFVDWNLSPVHVCFISISVVKHCLIIFNSRVFHFHISSEALSNNIYVYCYLIYTLQVDNMLSMTKNHTDCPTYKCSADPTPIPANTLVDWETIEKAIEDWSTLLDEADLRKVWQLHKEKSRVQSLSIVHTKLRNSFIQISLKDLRIPV